MKRKSMILLALCMLLCMASVLNVSAMEEMDSDSVALPRGESEVMPLWDYTSDVSLILSFSGTTAYCSLMVLGYPNASKIKANLWLYEKNSDGSWTLLDSWKNMVKTGSAFGTEQTYSPVSKGKTYKLYFTGKVYGPNGLYYDPLAEESIVTY